MVTVHFEDMANVASEWLTNSVKANYETYKKSSFLRKICINSDEGPMFITLQTFLKDEIQLQLEKAADRDSSIVFLSTIVSINALLEKALKYARINTGFLPSNMFMKLYVNNGCISLDHDETILRYPDNPRQWFMEQKLTLTTFHSSTYNKSYIYTGISTFVEDIVTGDVILLLPDATGIVPVIEYENGSYRIRFINIITLKSVRIDKNDKFVKLGHIEEFEDSEFAVLSHLLKTTAFTNYIKRECAYNQYNCREFISKLVH